MTASKSNPLYSVHIYSGGYKYNVTPAVLSIDISESKTSLAQSVDISMADAKIGNSDRTKRLSEILGVRDRVYIYADDGTTNDEVFRGFIWGRGAETSSDSETLSFKCYDHLIYLQESEVSEFTSGNQSTKTLVKKLCNKWGIKLQYEYTSITHSKMALRGYLSDIIISDLLDPVKERHGKEYVIVSIKDVMTVRQTGANTMIYHFLEKNNVISSSTECTMNGMITRVVIVGQAGNDELEPVEATLTGDTAKYGTLQKIIRRDSETTIEAAKEEGNNIIKANGKPKTSYIVKAPDIPWIRKGDKVYVNAGDIKKKDLIVDDIDRSISNSKKEMSLTLSEA